MNTALLLTAFGRRGCDLVLRKIDAVHRKSCLPDSATSVQRAFKGDLHPFRLRFQGLADLDDLLIGTYLEDVVSDLLADLMHWCDRNQRGVQKSGYRGTAAGRRFISSC
jgi:hypothetical protein